jgi:predicted amidohydrolase
MIVSPFGEVLAMAGEAIGLVSAEIDTALIEETRRRLPTRQQRRVIGMPEIIKA